MIKSGFGSLRLYTTKTSADRHLIFKFPVTKGAKRTIKRIHYSYSPGQPAPTSVFVQGRLIIGTGEPPGIGDQIIPSDSLSLPQSSPQYQNIVVLMDITLSSKNGSFDLGDGIELPDTATGFVMLTSPETTVETTPDFTPMVLSMTVVGQDRGAGDPFPKGLR